MRVHSPQSTVHGSVWRLLIDTQRSAAEQMAVDERLASDAILTVRFFRWDPPAISLGWKQLSPEWAAGLDVVERPTGGGIAFHGSDVSWSVVLPRTRELSVHVLMKTVCDSAMRVCASYGIPAETVVDCPGPQRIIYCLTQPSSYAVLIGEKKVAGMALRRYPESWLIQGSLLVRPITQRLRSALPTKVMEPLDRRAVSLEQAAGCPLSERQVIDRWAANWSTWWEASSKPMEVT